MKLQLNPVFETFCLLAGSNLGKKQKKETIKQLDDFGINGAAFYAANFPLIERYYATFFGHLTPGSRSSIFNDMSNELAIVIAIGLLLHPEWQNDPSTFSDDDLRAQVGDVVASFLGSEKEIIDALEASELPDQAKWQIAALLQQPKQKLLQVIEAVNANLATFTHTYTKLEAEILPLLTQFENQLKKDKLPSFINQALALNPTVNIMPSLAEPLLFMAFDEYCCAGLLLNRVFTGQDEALTDTEAIVVAKSLSDQSKLEILRALKNRKLYSLEIAHKLGLTPATTSHHMNMLLSAGLVEVSKKGSKVYYRLRADGINRYRTWLDDNLI
jgi:DNA-binding transcriptional ArsR family regulator